MRKKILLTLVALIMGLSQIAEAKFMRPFDTKKWLRGDVYKIQQKLTSMENEAMIIGEGTFADSSEIESMDKHQLRREIGLMEMVMEEARKNWTEIHPAGKRQVISASKTATGSWMSSHPECYGLEGYSHKMKFAKKHRLTNTFYRTYNENPEYVSNFFAEALPKIYDICFDHGASATHLLPGHGPYEDYWGHGLKVMPMGYTYNNRSGIQIYRDMKNDSSGYNYRAIFDVEYAVHGSGHLYLFFIDNDFDQRFDQLKIDGKTIDLHNVSKNEEYYVMFALEQLLIHINDVHLHGHVPVVALTDGSIYDCRISTLKGKLFQEGCALANVCNMEKSLL